MNTSICIGIAGYMGAGKSTCAQIIKGIKSEDTIIIDADGFAKKIMQNSPQIKQSLQLEFGDSIIKNGSIEYSTLGQLVFRNIDTLKSFNAIVHPDIKEELSKVINSNPEKYCIVDAALISYWNIESWFQQLFWIDASQNIRMKRLLKKLSIPPEEIKRRMIIQEMLFGVPESKQWSIIPNEGSLEAISESLRKYQ